MKKILCIITVTAMVCLVFAGCQHLPSDYSETPSANTFSVDEAAELIRQTLPTPSDKYYITYEYDRTLNEKTYYFFHVYTVSSQSLYDPETSKPFKMQFTYGWYYVDKSTKQVYQESAGGDQLIPVTSRSSSTVGQGTVSVKTESLE